MEHERITIPADGHPIIGHHWRAPSPRAAVLLHPATAVTQRFYQHFARYLVSQGFDVLTYDYRGTGLSRPGSLRGLQVTMSDWLDHDIATVTAWAQSRFAGLPLLAVGHSVGGHGIALSPSSSALHGAVLVASHAGATRLIRGAERWRVRLVMRALGPALCGLLGYMPGSRLGLGEDLPRGVMLQWARWTSLPRYFFDDPAMDAARRMAQQRIPLLALGFDDDPWANRDAVGMLLSGLTAAPLERREVSARALGLDGIGHMGFFRRTCEPVLWREVADWLSARAAARTGGA